MYYVAKTKALISCAVTARSRFSHDVAHMVKKNSQGMYVSFSCLLNWHAKAE